MCTIRTCCAEKQAQHGHLVPTLSPTRIVGCTLSNIFATQQLELAYVFSKDVSHLVLTCILGLSLCCDSPSASRRWFVMPHFVAGQCFICRFFHGLSTLVREALHIDSCTCWCLFLRVPPTCRSTLRDSRQHRAQFAVLRADISTVTSHAATCSIDTALGEECELIAPRSKPSVSNKFRGPRARDTAEDDVRQWAEETE